MLHDFPDQYKQRSFAKHKMPPEITQAVLGLASQYSPGLEKEILVQNPTVCSQGGKIKTTKLRNPAIKKPDIQTSTDLGISDLTTLCKFSSCSRSMQLSVSFCLVPLKSLHTQGALTLQVSSSAHLVSCPLLESASEHQAAGGLPGAAGAGEAGAGWAAEPHGAGKWPGPAPRNAGAASGCPTGV